VDDRVVIGAMVRQRVAERSALIAEELPMLAYAITYVAHFQIRNRGTVGGSAAYADPAAEIPAVLVAHDGSVEVRSAARGSRSIPAEQLYVGTFENSLVEDELLTEVHLPRLPDGAGWSFDEVTRLHGNYAIASVALWLTLDAGRIGDLRIAIGGAAARTVRAHGGERALRGVRPEPDALEACVEAVQSELEPTSDMHGSGDYRRAVTGVLVRRGLEVAIRRAKEAQL
jgi:carbon-monoxide dehydrogenase medium subunit